MSHPIDIQMEFDGISEADALDSVLTAIEGYEQGPTLLKAVNLRRDAKEILTPAVAVCAERFKSQMEVFIEGLIKTGDVFVNGSESDFKRIAKALRARPHEIGMFPLTIKKIKHLWETIKEHTNAFFYKYMGVKSSRDDISRWKRMGLIAKDAVLTDYVKDAYHFTRLANVLDSGPDYTTMKRLAKKNPLTPAQEAGFEWFKISGCEHIKGLADRFRRELMLHLNKEPDYSAKQQWYEEQIRKATDEKEKKLKSELNGLIEESKKAGKSRKELASELRQQTHDWTRDWDRIAATEFANMEDRGRAEEIRKKYGANAWVIRIPKDTACDGCKRLYLMPDGSPRPFRLLILEKNNTNAGRKWFNPKTQRWVCLQPQRIAQDGNGNFTDERGGWLPVIGATHPNCACVTVYYPDVVGWAALPNNGKQKWPVTIRSDQTAAEQWSDAMDRMKNKFVQIAEKRGK